MSVGKIISCVLCLISIVISGCGGGSEGTGTTSGFGQGRTLNGVLLDADGRPLAATITLQETGDSVQVSGTGNFTLLLPEGALQPTLEVSTDGNSSQLKLSSIESDAISVYVTLKLDSSMNVMQVSNYNVWARIVGDCDRYFENRAVIRQSVTLNRPVSCTIRFFASGDGRRLDRVPGAIQVRACKEKIWRTIAQGLTGFGQSAGVGEIDFTFIDNRRNCEYRVVAPFEQPGVQSIYVYLSTLTLQRSDQ